MFHILTPRHGAVLNHADGIEADGTLDVRVEGMADPGQEVWVNGVRASRDAYSFTAPVRLTDHESTIEAVTQGPRGRETFTVKVIYDKASFKRYRFFIDDHSFFFDDIAQHGYNSIFDCFYLARLRDVHEKYGAKFAINCFFRNDHGDFDLTSFPETYRSEWIDNAHWLTLSFHAYSEFPNRPYQHATPEKLAEDYDFVHDHLVRVAGEQTVVPPIVIHWAMVPPEAIPVLRERGVRVLCGPFINVRTGVGQSVSGDTVADIGYFLDLERSRYLVDHALIHDFDRGVTFHRGDTCCNLDPCEVIEQKLKARMDSPHFNEILGLASHEQYSFPHYHNYIPDHLDRIEFAARLATEAGYAPVFAHEGFMGNMVWE